VPRRAAVQLLSSIVDEGRSLDARLESEDSPFASLEPQDRSFARAIVSMALRRRGQISAALDGLMQRKLPARSGSLQTILKVTAAQILFLEVPDHAAVATALELADGDPKARHFKPLANGVLRNLARQRDAILAGQDAARLNTPDWLWQRWSDAFGDDAAKAMAETHLSEPPLDITVKTDAPAWAERLGGVALPTGTVRLKARGRIEALAGYDEGSWWVQDFAAALPARFLGDVRGRRVLDLCAAPGGKTAQLASAGAIVTAVDVSDTRMRRLKANLGRLHLEADCVVADATTFQSDVAYDAVLVDAPCSATGTIRRHPDIPWVKTEADLRALVAAQHKLIANAISLARPGAPIVFATCSLQPEEGKEQANWALAGHPISLSPIMAGEAIGVEDRWISQGWLRTLPSFSPDLNVGGGMDGFFAARFVRQ
jgi:16S rRNA (cytosine967-C5)-methyltransferase